MRVPLKKAAVLALVAVVAMLTLAEVYPALRYRGDGRFIGEPILGYRIKMRPIPFWREGEYVFHFHGAPNERMSLQLYADGKSDDDRAELTNLSTSLEAVLVDQTGRVVCHGSGIIPIENRPCDNCKVWTQAEIDARLQREWVLMSGADAAYWHANCVGVRLKPSDFYSLTLRIEHVDPRTPKINLVPTFEGGQPDLP